MNFNLEAPFNCLSFGNISFGILYELFRRGISPNLFPLGGNADLSAFDKVDNELAAYFNACIGRAGKYFKKGLPGLKVWHINGSWLKVSDNQSLLTFFELDQLTETEVNILNNQTRVFVTSKQSKTVMESYGVTVPVIFTPMGFDVLHFHKLSKPYLEEAIVFTICGKIEKRKHTIRAIKLWIKKFGGNKKYRLHLYITNQFCSPEEMNGLYTQIFEGKQPPFNVTIFGFLPTNSLLNDAFNATNVIIDMSGGESLSLPSLTCVALGKHAVIHNASAMSDWATDENAVLVSPSGKEPSVDGKFFLPNQPFNQGNIWTWKDEDYMGALDKVVARVEANPVNPAGVKLQTDYSYAKGVDILLENLK